MSLDDSQPKIIDNISSLLRDDLVEVLTSKSVLQIAASCFSIYAFKALREKLLKIDRLQFLFTAPTFVLDAPEKDAREFYIPQATREQSLYGTEFEVRLRNVLEQKAIAKECADWIREKAEFKSNVTNQIVPGFIHVNEPSKSYSYLPFNAFTTIDLGCERGNYAYNFVQRLSGQLSSHYATLFNQLWNNSDSFRTVTEQVIEHVATIYNENAPEEIYFLTLYHVFSEFLKDLSEDLLPNEATGFKASKIWNLLYDFQRDAVLAIINKLEQYNGCILADSVGLGKTFTALAVVKYYENRNKNVLVLCPKKLAANWNTYKDNYVNNPIASDRLRYDVLFHTDLSRDYGLSNGLDLERLNWENYDLVVIDESHNFRNGGALSGEEQKENRYLRLMNRVIKAGVKTKVLMLSATPVNNRFYDLRNQLQLAYEGCSDEINQKLNTSKHIDEIFRQAQGAFNAWSKQSAQARTTDNLLKSLDFDFFEVLDSVTIARSRKHIEKYYNTEQIGKFPERLKPISLRPPLTDLHGAINYNEIYEQLMALGLEIYTPSAYLFESRREKYQKLMKDKGAGLTQRGREEGIRRLMSVNLLKRLESSVHSFALTLERIKTQIEKTVSAINLFESKKSFVNGILEVHEVGDISDWDADDQNTDFFSVGKKVKIDLADMDYLSWRAALQKDIGTLTLLTSLVADITPEHDSKLQTLLRLLSQKIEHPLNDGNRKVLIFSAFSDTAEYLYRHVSAFVKQKYGLHTALVTGTIDGQTTLKGIRGTLNNILTCFSPISKNRDVLMPQQKESIDILIATDCISEGQNLQDCDYLVNYDIHWNPVRIIQRFGRVDRIGSKNACIQLVNFWPDMDLDEYINLKARVETRMKISVMTSTGDDNIISPEEKGELEYRTQQLKRLQEEVVDIEEMSGGVSIMDLGLNEFRLDLLEYLKTHEDLKKKPLGLHAVVPANADLPEGVIFVLKNRNDGVNIDHLNRVHPFYMVYVGEDGTIHCDYLNPKRLLDTIRLACKGREEPIKAVYQRFNAESKDGREMSKVSSLLSEAISSIIETKDESDIDSLFSAGGTTALLSTVSGWDDFELICFLVIQSEAKC